MPNATRPAIRAASPDDAAALVDIRERMFAALGVDDAEKVARLHEIAVPWTRDAIAGGGAVGFLAERDGELVGGVTMVYNQEQPQLRSPDGRVALIYGLFVEEAERGVGIGRELVDACIERARRDGLALVTLHAAPDARPLYERIGFENTSQMRIMLD